MAWFARTAEAYKRLLKGVMPSGPIWSYLATADLDATTAGTADELARVDGRIADLSEEVDPRTADETIDQWETDLGLPDPGDPSPPTALADRQAAAYAALIASGGQHAAYYVEVAAALGVVVTITERPYGDPAAAEVTTSEEVIAPPGASYYWLVDGPAGTDADVQARLEALITRLAPAHTVPVFTWTA